PRDLRALATSLAALPALADELAPFEASLLKMLGAPLQSDGVKELGALLARAVVEEPPAVTADGGFIAKGFNLELDGYLELSQSGKGTLLALETRERERTGIGSLKVRYNRVFGYYLEVTKANLHLVPKE